MLDVEGKGVHDVGVVAPVVHQDDLVKDLRRAPVQDTPHSPQESGECLIVEDDDHAGGGEVVEDIGEGLALPRPHV